MSYTLSGAKEVLQTFVNIHSRIERRISENTSRRLSLEQEHEDLLQMQSLASVQISNIEAIIAQILEEQASKE